MPPGCNNSVGMVECAGIGHGHLTGVAVGRRVCHCTGMEQASGTGWEDAGQRHWSHIAVCIGTGLEWVLPGLCFAGCQPACLL